MAATATRSVPPGRSLEQRMTALAKGNDHRVRRAQLKRDIQAGRRSASTIIATPPEWAENMKLFDLLLAVPKWGRVKVNRSLGCCDVSRSKTVAGISPRQRGELLRWLHGR